MKKLKNETKESIRAQVRMHIESAVKGHVPVDGEVFMTSDWIIRLLENADEYSEEFFEGWQVHERG